MRNTAYICWEPSNDYELLTEKTLDPNESQDHNIQMSTPKISTVLSLWIPISKFLTFDIGAGYNLSQKASLRINEAPFKNENLTIKPEYEELNNVIEFNNPLFYQLGLSYFWSDYYVGFRLFARSNENSFQSNDNFPILYLNDNSYERMSIQSNNELYENITINFSLIWGIEEFGRGRKRTNIFSP